MEFFDHWNDKCKLYNHILQKYFVEKMTFATSASKSELDFFFYKTFGPKMVENITYFWENFDLEEFFKQWRGCPFGTIVTQVLITYSTGVLFLNIKENYAPVNNLKL